MGEEAKVEAKPDAAVEAKLTEFQTKVDQALSKLDTALASNEALTAEITRLKELGNKTPGEEAKLKSLETMQQRVAKVRSLEGADVWEHIIKEEVTKAKSEAINDFSINLMYDFIESKAKEENIKPEELEKELERFALGFDDLPPHRRAQAAYAERMERKKFHQEKTEFETTKKNEEALRLGGGSFGGARQPGLGEAIKNAQSQDDWVDILAKL